MQRVLEAIPYAQFLGVQVEQIGEAWRCVLPFRQEIVGNPRLPAIHGGVLGAFLELTAFLRLYAEAGGERAPKPINFSADYLRSADPFRVVTWFGPLNTWHPNIAFGAPVICIGRLSPGTGLVDIIYQVFEIVTWNKVTMREDDALNARMAATALFEEGVEAPVVAEDEASEQPEA